ncbi:MAG: FAD-dependent oxidoreductase [Chloroflexi bacterium]|nr:FAD-dependent oxidoreductase [Chloroflexota bacterium]
MTRDSVNTQTNSRVAIIGGGPAGSFFALYLLHYAGQTGRQFDVTIYQERDFSGLGTKGCKGCAGILSIPLVENLKELNLTIPEYVIQSKIEHFAVHSPYTSISLSNPEKGVKIFSVYRGGGPRISHYDRNISFDGWLLAQAQQRGARVQNQRVSRISIKPAAQVEAGGEKLDYDLIVLASGVNGRSISIQGLDYLPTRTQTMAQDELFAGVDAVASKLGNTAHVFLIPKSGLVFGTLVPKGPFINVSLLSTGKRPVSVTDFLNHEMVRSVLPERIERSCGCRPRTLIHPARNYYSDRFVAIGDAAVTRLYKDGIGSSLLTAREAARNLAYHGLSGRDFRRYYQPLCRRMGGDNQWGKLLFSMNDRAKDSRRFLLTQRRLIADEQSNTAGAQPFTRAAWGMFTGAYAYRSIARMVFSPPSVARLSFALFRESLLGLFRKQSAYPRKLFVGGKRILILGSGFGGTYCLRHLVRRLNKNENVETTVVSNENFFLFSPLLHEVAMGSIETRHIAYPIRKLQWRDRFRFVQAEVKKIDLNAHRVMTTGGAFDYDYLILALGSVTDTSDLASAEENVFTLKTLHDAMLLRNRVIAVFEQANAQKEPAQQKRLLTFVVSGGGYVGIQLITQIRDLIHKSLVKVYKEIDPANIRIILVEAEVKIVAGLHTKLGAYIMKHLQQMGIEVRLKSRVTRVWKDRVEIDGGEIIPTSTVVWVTGVVANPRIAELNAERDKQGRVFVNEYMEVLGFPGVYALGDCAHFEDPQTGKPIPPRAHIAVRQAKVVARNVLAEIRGLDKKPYFYDNSGEIVSLGDTNAVFRYRGLRFYGFPARLVWIAAYSLLVTGAYNRARILTDWIFSSLFGRDTTFLRLTSDSIISQPESPALEDSRRRDL